MVAVEAAGNGDRRPRSTLPSPRRHDSGARHCIANTTGRVTPWPLNHSPWVLGRRDLAQDATQADLREGVAGRRSLLDVERGPASGDSPSPDAYHRHLRTRPGALRSRLRSGPRTTGREQRAPEMEAATASGRCAARSTTSRRRGNRRAAPAPRRAEPREIPRSWHRPRHRKVEITPGP